MNPSETAGDEDFWFPVDLFTDELNFNDLPNGAEVVSQSSRADNSTIFSDELELDVFEEIPQTIDVPQKKKARIEGGESEHFSSDAHSSQPLLASWQPKDGGTEQFSFQASHLPTPPVPMPSTGLATSPTVNNIVKASKSEQMKDLLAILCENISSDPNQSVQDLMTLRLLLIRPQLTPEEDHLLNTVLIFYESYLTAGRTRPDIATMVVRDFSFHFKHQQQTYAAVPVMPHYAPMVSPVLRGQTPVFSHGYGFLSPPNTISPRSSVTY
jgi:hypothetical protein